jgi:predicted Rossmann fold flavoprotein
VDADVVVVGAGAAGMMCAAQAGARGRGVVLVEHYGKLGEKIRISGGGRCNFTNIHATSANFLSRNPDFSRSALARYTPRDFIALVERHGIAWHEKTLGQLFCDDSATQIIEMLRAECEQAGVQWRMPTAVRSVARDAGRFVVDTDAGVLRCASLVIATGGLSVPKIGATPFGYRVAEQFGLAVVPPRPALVPLSFDVESLARFGDLSGISIDAEVSLRDARFRENLLITHRGLSGPAILQISSYWQDGPASEAIHIDLMPGFDAAAWLRERQRDKVGLATLLAERLPKRFAQAWCEAHDIAKAVNQFSAKALEQVARDLHDWPVRPSGTLGYNKAEVTLGGVDTRGLSSRTMEAVAVPGLYFIGEVVDVTGHLGGFNFQWAWASAHAAGQAA